MAKNVYRIIAVAACIMATAEMFMISSLQSRVESFERQLSSMESMLSSRMNAVVSNVNTKLEEYTNLLADSSWSFGGADIAGRTVEVILSVTPKENYPGNTSAEIFLGGKGYPMNANGGTYEAFVTLSLFENVIVEKVVFTEEGRTRTEKLGWGISPRYDFLPVMSANYIGSSHFSKSENGYSQFTNGTLHLDLYLNKRPFEMKSAELVDTLNGAEVYRAPITLGTTNPDSAHSNDTAGEIPWQDRAAAGSVDYIDLYCALQREYEIPKGGHYESFVEITDGHGLTYRCKISSAAVDDSGELSDNDDFSWMNIEAEIYSPDGEVLFKTEYM